MTHSTQRRRRIGIPLLLAVCWTFRCGADDYDLFILAGQSNAVGFEAAPDQLPHDAADQKIPFFFDCGDPPFDGRDSSSSNRWTFLRAQPRGNPAHDAKARQYGNFSHPAGGFGPEISFARTLFYSQRVKPAIFKFAYNGTGFANTNDWSPGRPLYRAMVARYESARSQLERGGSNRVTLRAMVWIQGESDCGRGQTAYEQRFGDFIRQLRTDLRQTNLLALAGFNTNIYGRTWEIVRAQQALAARDGHVRYVETGGAALTGPPPVAHFNAAGTLDVGERFARAYLAADSADEGILAGLRREHPRILITSKDWATFRANRGNTNDIARVIARVEADARALLKESPVVYKKDGKRLLAVSREAMRRIEFLSFASRITGEKEFLERARKEMLAVAAFKDWNPSHFLDVAEMCAGLAIGYDWLFDDLSAATRAEVREAIIEKGLKPGLDSHGQKNWWQTRDNNWNQVCFGGLTLGALAIAEERPEIARNLLALARQGNLNGLKPYAPDGIYPEGPNYWNYGTSYQVLLLSALETALGTDWNLPAAPGFRASGLALVEQTGPSGRPFNFSDCPDGVIFQPALFWFAQELHQPELAAFQRKLLQQELSAPQSNFETSRFFPLLAIWLGGLPEVNPLPPLPLAWHGGGGNPVGVFRSSWSDPEALFLAFKGGAACNNHGHMDAGSFVLDADGVRWVCDLGSQDYLSVESKGWDLWDSSQDGDRWRVFRLNNFSHNTLTLGGQLHHAAGRAEITAFTANSATVDLSDVFAGQAKSVTRQFTLGDDRSVNVRDEVAGAKPGLKARWQVVTHAKISVQGDQAIMRQDGNTLLARIVAPLGAEFATADAQPPRDGVNKPNPNARILLVDAGIPSSGNLTIEVELQPASQRQR